MHAMVLPVYTGKIMEDTSGIKMNVVDETAYIIKHVY
jgi:hypothetical protein